MPILSWVNRDYDTKSSELAPYRLLEADDSLSGGDLSSPNMLIQGDNLEALKALLPYYAGRVKCIYIDPPYNTLSAKFIHYDDNLEHSQWLAMMFPRLQLLRDLLSEDGSIWISIDDNESHYLKIIMDEVFGRAQFIASNVWQKRYSRENREAIGDVHEYILTYAKNPERFKRIRHRIPLNEEQAKIYKNTNNDPKGRWRSIPMTAQGFRKNQMYKIRAPGGAVHTPPEGRCWSLIEPEYEKLRAQNRIYFGKDNNSQPNIIRYLSEVEGMVPWTWWNHEEVGHTDEAKKEIHEIFGKSDAFDTPKPERLIHRILQIATDPGDLVLDSFLGSGTTAAVAHKMGRRYIGVEMGAHAVTHCVPRLNKVIQGEQGGISKSVDWSGGGGFRFYRLGEPVFDADGRLTDGIRFGHLAAHIWFSETRVALRHAPKTPLLGVHNGAAFYLLYNGILGDKRPDSGNVLTARLLSELPPHDGIKVIYGEASRLGPSRLKDLGIQFKQTPYDVKAR
ncbi:site-specific DNA-methyltransferase [Methylobacterium tarhaniae]|uniref:site-specific DNA-methyltransferase n=1 Tax=Methylobacterium tarhaniae TaxID=1187852 RepID=UPI003D03E331